MSTLIRLLPVLVLVALLALGVTHLLDPGVEDGPLNHAASGGPLPTETASARVSVGPRLETSPTASRGDNRPVPAAVRLFEVRILDAHTNEPIAGAYVYGPDDRGRATSDIEGVARFEEAAGSFEALIEVRGYVREETTLDAGSMRTVRLKPGLDVRGRLFVGNAAIAGAYIQAFDVDRKRFITRAVKTNAEGRFRLRGVRAHHPLRVVVVRRGFLPRSRVLTVHDDQAELVLVFEPGGEVDILVLDDKEVPVGSAEVLLVEPGTRLDRPEDEAVDQTPGAAVEAALWGRLHPTMRTNKEGRLVIRGVPLHWPFQVHAGSGTGREVRSASTALAEAGERQEVRLQLPAWVNLQVQVVTDYRDPYPGDAEFTLFGTRQPVRIDLHPSSVDDRGVRHFERVPAGTYRLRVRIVEGPETTLDLALPWKQRDPPRVAFELPATISGTVWAPSRRPVPLARVSWRPKYGRGHALDGRADDHGRWGFIGTGETRGILSAAVDSHFDQFPRFPELQEELNLRSGAVIDLRMEAWEWVHGRVRTSLPVPLLVVRSTVWGSAERFVVDLDAEQDFRIPRPIPRMGSMTFESPGFSPKTVHFKPTEALAPQIAVLVFDPPLEVRVRAVRGSEPVPGVLVGIPARREGETAWRTDQDGYVTLRGLRIGKQTIRLTLPDGTVLQRPLNAQPGMDPVEIQVPEHHERVLGSVRKRGGTFFPNARLLLRRQADPSTPATTSVRADSVGTFQTRLAPGTWYAFIDGNPKDKGYRFTVLAGQATQLLIRTP